MKKLFILLCAVLCTNKIVAQSVGDIVADGNSISYKIDNVVLLNDKDVSTDDLSYNGEISKSAPYINYNHIQNVTVSSKATVVCGVAGYNGNVESDLFLDVTKANGSKNYSVSYESNIEEYSKYSSVFLENHKTWSEKLSSGILNGTATYMSYSALKERMTLKNKTIYVNGKSVNQNKFETSVVKGNQDKICMLVIEGSLNLTCFPVISFNVTESFECECTPTSVSSDIDWKGSKLNVAECVESVAEGAFATASYAVRAIDDNNNCYEPIFAYSSKHGSPRYGLYVGKNFNGDLTSEVKAGLCFVDFSSNTSNVDHDLLTNVNRNCLCFFPAGSSVKGENVVVGNVCDNLVLSRESAYPFYNIKPFTANNMTMNNVTFSSSKFVAYCFPFNGLSEITVGNTTSSVNELLTVAQFKGYENETLSYSFKNGISSNMPCIIMSKNGNYTSFSAKNVEVVATEPDVKLSTDNLGGWRMVGSYQAVQLENEDYEYFGLSNNSIAKATLHSTTLKPFSSIMVKMDENADISNVRLRVDEDEVNGVDQVEVAELSVDSNNGITLSGSSFAKVSSISGSVIFNGMVNGTKSFDVPSGVYVVNGKKIYVK